MSTGLPRLLSSARFLAVVLLTVTAGCDGSVGVRGRVADPAGAPIAGSDARLGRPGDGAQRLPAFEDFPVAEAFTGEPAEVNLESHPDAKTFRTALTRDAKAGAVDKRFAGHYRIVVIGCGTSCKSVWAVDLVDGSLRSLFTASTGVDFRPDSRLIIENDDPAYYEGLLDEMSVEEAERIMDTYGPPRFWIEVNGDFEQIGPRELRIDPQARKIVPVSGGTRHHPLAVHQRP